MALDIPSSFYTVGAVPGSGAADGVSAAVHPAFAPDLTKIREDHIAHENAMKTLGVMHLIGGAALLLSCLGVVVGGFEFASLSGDGDSVVEGVAIFVVLLLLGISSVQLGTKLRKLDPSAWQPARTLSMLGLLAFPIGTMISIANLGYLNSAKGKFVFTGEYARVIEMTPDTKAKTSRLVKVLLALVLSIFALFATVVLWVLFK